MNVSLGCAPEAYIATVIDTVNAETVNIRLKHIFGTPSEVLGGVNTNGGCTTNNNIMHIMLCITSVINVLCNTEIVLGGGTNTGQGPNFASMLSATMRPNQERSA